MTTIDKAERKTNIHQSQLQLVSRSLPLPKRSLQSGTFIYVIFCFVLLFGIGCTRNAPTIPELERKLEPILELPTCEYIYKTIVYVGEQKSVFMIKTIDRAVLFSINIRIQAGTNLTEGFSIVTKDNKKVTITLPPIEVLLNDADESSIHQYFAKERGGSLNRLEYYAEINKKKDELEKTAIEQGILTEAERNVRTLVYNILVSSGFEDIEIIFTDGT